MITIGILLPGSTLYPSIGFDFIQGVKSSLHYHGVEQINIVSAAVGFGLDEKEIHKQTENFLLANDADIVIAFADNKLGESLAPLFSAAGKLLIMTDGGANYPVKKTLPNIIFHSLNECIYSFLTGKLNTAQTALMATSYYDGGYDHSHAMIHSFSARGGRVGFNIVSHYKKEAFTLQNLETFLEKDSTVTDLLCIFSGDMARFFYDHVSPLQKKYGLRIFGSSMMFDKSVSHFTDAALDIENATGYVGWLDTLENKENKNFITYINTTTDKEPNVFLLQGWEVAQLAMEYLQCKDNGLKTTAAIEALKKSPPASPRGQLQIHQQYNYVFAPAYKVTANGNMQITIDNEITDTNSVIDEINNIPEMVSARWRNTYLCI